ncbi:AAA family ATPase [Roseibium sp.]|uniref:AAA family ATPase n=1 Tax=Roseibium sp. TaxID=1936156 RepID=UPI003A96F4F8
MLEAKSSRDRKPKHRFVDIEASREIRKAMEIAKDIPQYPVLISSKPGMGKTTALKHHAEDKGTFYCEAGQASKSTKGMLKMLIDATGYSSGYQYIKDLSETAIERLSVEYFGPMMIIVDEVQTLELSAFRELLRLQEMCGFSLVLSGNDRRLARTRIQDSALDQIVSRLGLRVELGAPTEEDCRNIGIDFDVEGKDAYDALRNFGHQTSVRDLVRLLTFAEQLRGASGSIQMHHLKTAFLTIYGSKKDLKLLAGR